MTGRSLRLRNMPKETFHKLNSDKKNEIIKAFLREFSSKTYDEASITNVVKSLGIAKGSIYQYFDDKLDLYLYLQRECNNVKMGYISSIRRDDFPDFFSASITAWPSSRCCTMGFS